MTDDCGALLSYPSTFSTSTLDLEWTLRGCGKGMQPPRGVHRGEEEYESPVRGTENRRLIVLWFCSLFGQMCLGQRA